MLKITLSGGEKLIEALKTKPVTIVSVLTGKLNALLFQLQSYIVSKKLSGQVLHRRTGVLSGSVRVIPATVAGASIIGGVEAAGGPAFYGAIHELGGTSSYQIVAVKARALAFMVNGKKIFATRVTHPAIKARPFMSTSLAENAENIKTELQAALDVELSKP